MRHAGATRIHGATRAAVVKGTPSCGSSCASYESAINQYFTDVAHDSGTSNNVYSVATQYFDTTGSIAYQSTFGGSDVVTSAYPTSGCNDGTDSVCLTDAQLQTEIRSVISANAWPTGTSSLFFIFTPSNVGICAFGGGTSGNECSSNYFCAYHDSFSSGGSSVVYAVEPYDATLQLCSPPASPNGDDADATINTISHEMMEAITDPLPYPGTAGWWTDINSQNEIGDLCAWKFGTALGSTGTGAYNQVINGHDYYLQEEYSNADLSPTQACVQRLNGTPGPTSSGHGPLVYQGGPVMRTNTVYAIYWIPGGSPAPVSTAPPVVSGVAGVGKTLTTTNGSWSGSPTSFAYKWQQCSATGTSCTDISGATSASYKLAAGDAGHEIRSEVSAHNANGSSGYVAATPTEVVVPVPAVTVAPVVSGVATVGRTLATTQGTWNTPVTYAYQWLRCTATGTGCATIAHATSLTYTVATADLGHELEARVSATNAAATATALSGQTAAVVGLPATSRLPAIIGKAKVGRRLAIATGHWTGAPSAFHYQWLRCNRGGGSCVHVKGATKSSYRLTKRDATHRMRVQITASNAAGTSRSTSAATHVVKK